MTYKQFLLKRLEGKLYHYHSRVVEKQSIFNLEVLFKYYFPQLDKPKTVYKRIILSTSITNYISKITSLKNDMLINSSIKKLTNINNRLNNLIQSIK